MVLETSLAVTIIILLVSMGIWLGKLWSDVQHNRKDIDGNRETFEKCVEDFRRDNREDHRLIHQKLDTLSSLIRNGHAKGS